MRQQLTKYRKEKLAAQKAYQLSKALQEFYSSHPLSIWQKEKVDEIRNRYKLKQKELNVAHDIASSRLSEAFMQFELDYLYASEEYRKENPGMEWHTSGIKGLFTKAFWANLSKKAEQIGLNFYGKKAETK